MANIIHVLKLRGLFHEFIVFCCAKLFSTPHTSWNIPVEVLTYRVVNTADPDQVASLDISRFGCKVFSTKDKFRFGRARVKRKDHLHLA